MRKCSRFELARKACLMKFIPEGCNKTRKKKHKLEGCKTRLLYFELSFLALQNIPCP